MGFFLSYEKGESVKGGIKRLLDLGHLLRAENDFGGVSLFFSSLPNHSRRLFAFEAG